MLPQADRFAPRSPAAVETVRTAEGSVTGDDLLAAARAAGLATGARLVSTLPWELPSGVAGTLLAALAVDGSLVHSDSTGDALIAEAVAERATVTGGFDAPGLTRLN